ncbi:MAG: hypothetical protein ABIT37_01165 [Luteolibacter sp.]
MKIVEDLFDPPPQRFEIYQITSHRQQLAQRGGLVQHFRKADPQDLDACPPGYHLALPRDERRCQHFLRGRFGGPRI